MSSNKVIAIALDAAEWTLIEKWIKEGYLKNLASLHAKGSFGKLSSTAEWLAGSPWPTFYTGVPPEEHGLYHYIQWKSDKMDYTRPGPEWINATPFWRGLSNCKVIAVDIPLTFPPIPFNGIEISGWSSHDGIYPTSSFPKDKIDWVKKTFGEAPVGVEMGGLQSLDTLDGIKKELSAATNKLAELVVNLIDSEEWDLCLCCFSSTHRGGHKFWDNTSVKDKLSGEQESLFQNHLRDIYQSCDDAIGKILNIINEDATVLIFSLHGMGFNTSLADKVLPKMISNILNGKEISGKNKSFIKKIRDKIPLEWRSGLKKFLPIGIQDKMTAYWRMGRTDWSKTRVFNLLADLQGYIRINLKGREKNGIVQEGEDYDNLCSHLIEGLKTFKDSETGEPVIESIKSKDTIFKKGNAYDHLPDLLVKWNNKPVSGYRNIFSQQFGEIKFTMPGKNHDGRSGNHRPEGFLLASGKNIKTDLTFEKKHIIDLAPTILHLLDQTIPEDFEGKVINEIFQTN